MLFAASPVTMVELDARMKFVAIIFDLFGTLVDDFSTSIGSTNVDLAVPLEVPSEPFAKAWRQTAEMRVNGTFQTVEASIEYVCCAIGVEVSQERVAKAVEIRLQQIRRGLEPKPDALTTLRLLKDNGYKIGLLSNCSIEIPILWPTTEFALLIDTAIFSSWECLKKPDPRIFRAMCERLSVAPKDCLYIADGENYELAAAAKVGLHPVLIRNPASQKRLKLFREAREWQGDSIDNLTEVLQRVRN